MSVTSLLGSIAAHIAVRTGLQWEGDDSARELHVLTMPDGGVPAIVSCIRLGSAAPKQFTPTDDLSIQITTRGRELWTTLERAERIWAAFIDEHRLPLRHTQLSADWKLLHCDPIYPQPLGLDAGGRAEVVMNMTMRVVALGD